MEANYDRRHAVGEGTPLSARDPSMDPRSTDREERNPKSTSATIGADRDAEKYRSAQPTDDLLT